MVSTPLTHQIMIWRTTIHSTSTDFPVELDERVITLAVFYTESPQIYIDGLVRLRRVHTFNFYDRTDTYVHIHLQVERLEEFPERAFFWDWRFPARIVDTVGPAVSAVRKDGPYDLDLGFAAEKCFVIRHREARVKT